MNKYMKGIMLGGLMLLAACGSKDEAKPVEKTVVNIFQFKVEIAEQLDELSQIYMESHPNVEINIETVGGGDDYGAALRAKMASGNEPAIFNVGGPQDVYDWQDKLVDLSDTQVAKNAFDGSLSGATLDGKVYGLPFTQEGYGFIYNKEMFKKAGIDPSKIVSYATLENAVKILNSKKDELGVEAVFATAGKETWVTGLHFSNVGLSQEFGSVFDAYNSKTVNFTYSDGMKKLFDLQINNSRQPVNATDYSTQVERLFSMKKVVMIQQGNWAYGSIKGIDEDLAANIGFLPMPIVGAKENVLPVGIPMYWTVNKSSTDAEQKAAKEFLNWMYTSDTGKDYVINQFNFIPPYKGFEGDNLQPKDPLAKDIMKFSEAGNTIPWVFMGYPTGWGMETLGVDLQKYIDGQLTWDKVIKNSKSSWEENRNN